VEPKSETKPEVKAEVKPKEAMVEPSRPQPVSQAPVPNPQFQPSREKELVYPRPNTSKASE